MIVVRIDGGLGNQMFQYAAGRKIALDKGTTLKLYLGDLVDDPSHKRSFQLSALNIQAGFASKMDLFLTKFLHLGTYLPGYWQSAKYFSGREDTLRKDFTFKAGPRGKNRTLLNDITKSQSVSLHIRREDYLNKLNKYHILDEDYYHQAVAYIKSKVKLPKFFVFAESAQDRQWARNFLKVGGSSVFVSNNSSQNGSEDLRLMIACKHNIIANSTFSWWGAWLNKNHGKIVVAPKKWYRSKQVEDGFIPSSWKLI